MPNDTRAHRIAELFGDAPWWARWLLIGGVVGMPVVGGAGGVASLWTIPQRLTAVEQQVARSDSLRTADLRQLRNETSTMRGEINGIKVQISYFVCLDERIDDPLRRQNCASIRQQVEAILQAQANER